MRSGKRSAALLAAGLLLAAATGCTALKEKASEGDTQLAVVIGGKQAGVLTPVLKRGLQPVLHTPQPELRFYAHIVGGDSLGIVSRWQNVVLLGALEAQDSVSARIRRMLSDDLLQGVRSGEHSLVRRSDLWVRGQSVVVVVKPTRAELVTWVQENVDRIYQVLAEDRRQRMKEEIYALGEQDELADSLRGAHGWRLRIPNDYALVSSSPSPSFVRLKRLYPERLLSVAWREGSAEDVEADTLIAWRDRLGAHFADTVRVNPLELASRRVTLAGREAVKVTGLWETAGPLGGGPFVAYLLHDQGTLYLLDGQVYAPDRAKEPYIRQFEVILKTFQP